LLCDCERPVKIVDLSRENRDSTTHTLFQIIKTVQPAPEDKAIDARPDCTGSK
jgi:hypothetical protein